MERAVRHYCSFGVGLGRPRRGVFVLSCLVFCCFIGGVVFLCFAFAVLSSLIGEGDVASVGVGDAGSADMGDFGSLGVGAGNVSSEGAVVGNMGGAVGDAGIWFGSFFFLRLRIASSRIVSSSKIRKISADSNTVYRLVVNLI